MESMDHPVPVPSPPVLDGSGPCRLTSAVSPQAIPIHRLIDPPSNTSATTTTTTITTDNIDNDFATVSSSSESSRESPDHVLSDDLASNWSIAPPVSPTTVSMRRDSDLSVASPTTPIASYSVTLVAANESLSPEPVPKVEEVEEDGVDVVMKSVDSASTTTTGDTASTATSGPVVPAPRKRGRPRKHPLPIPGTQPVKVTKGRSKTGCITCRRRKKKCDETKPSCLNCEKNAVVCEGYPPKEIWKSGKQKAEDAARRRSLSALPRGLPILIDGIETEIDRRFLDHFVFEFSRVLTLINDDSNPFKEILLPMATQHRGLMHSLMCLSGSHLSARDPDVRLKERKHYHFDRAVTDLRRSIDAARMAKKNDGEPELLVEDPIIASTLALCLNTICEGETGGEYRTHMDAARYLLVTQKPKNEKFRQFIIEFFQYHDVSNSITCRDRRPLLASGELHLPDFVPHAQASAFLGIFDGLFNYISAITKLRDRIRQRAQEGYEPAVDYQTLSEAVNIDSGLRTWEPSYPPETPNWCAAQLYRQSTWVYLYRTIRPSRPSEKISQVVDDALRYLDMLPRDSGAYSIMLMPMFLIGCSAFEERQRARIRQGFDDLKRYSNLRNIEPARQVVEHVWEVMDTRMEDSWDWEKIIEDMKMDFLIT